MLTFEQVINAARIAGVAHNHGATEQWIFCGTKEEMLLWARKLSDASLAVGRQFVPKNAVAVADAQGMTCNNVAWAFVVPPKNSARIIIMQRQDGPFAKDVVGGSGHYYVSEEALDALTSTWVHVPGSAFGGFDNYDRAFGVATELWARRKASFLLRLPVERTS